ncbi:MAG: hypothetical protein ACI9HE_004117, partial [Planctomycetota bacterium]
HGVHALLFQGDQEPLEEARVLPAAFTVVQPVA